MSTNPWLEPDEPASLDLAERAPLLDDEQLPVATGPAVPQPAQLRRPAAGLSDLGLGEFTPSTDELWVVGVHGGAGETTVASALSSSATGQHWPTGSPSAAVLLVARTHARGLERLRAVATSWAAGQLPPVALLGAVLVPDAPGRLPAPLAQLARLTVGGLPHHWFLDWEEELRFGSDAESLSSRRIRRVRREITSLYEQK